MKNNYATIEEMQEQIYDLMMKVASHKDNWRLKSEDKSRLDNACSELNIVFEHLADYEDAKTPEKNCGNCRYFSDVSEFNGDMVGYCVAVGTDSNKVTQPACYRWNERKDGTFYDEQGRLITLIKEE